LFVYFCDLVFLLLLVLFCFAGTARHFSAFPHITSGEQRNSKATSLQIGFQEYKTNLHPNGAEFHFGWDYTFSATLISLRI